ncbi:MAG: hypothetical protein LBT83_06220 [Tannerella sp.]|jgi:hypothetical protein|nr:hypothetical protein [Tannerella sp.]
MNTLFDFNRAGLLIRRYFTERFHTELIYWGIFTIVLMLFRNNLPTIGALLFVAGAFFASRFSREIHSPTNRMNYFMIPATQLEKITVSIVITIVYYFGMFLITYVIGNLIGTGLTNLLAKVDFLSSTLNLFHPTELKWQLFEFFEQQVASFNGIQHSMNALFIRLFFRVFLVTQSIFMLGGIYFKRNQTLKTVFALTVVGFAFLILLILELKLFVWDNNFSANKEDLLYLWETFKIITNVFLYSLVPFLWITSYFRLTEKEV